MAASFEGVPYVAVRRGRDTTLCTTASAGWFSLSPTVGAATFLFAICGELTRSLNREGEVGCNFHTTTSPSNSMAAAATGHTRQMTGPLRRRDAPPTVVAAREASRLARNAWRRECSSLKGACWFHTAAFKARRASVNLRWSDKRAAQRGQLNAWSTAPCGSASAPALRASSTTMSSNWRQFIESTLEVIHPEVDNAAAPRCILCTRARTQKLALQSANSGGRPTQFLQQQAACAMQPGSHSSHSASQ